MLVSKRMAYVLARIWYPLFILASITTFLALLTAGATPLLASYAPITIAGIAIALLELIFSEHIEWRPRLADVQADVAFMVLVQLVLPRALALTVAVTLATWAHNVLQVMLWPHHWPLLLQILLMVLLVDFMRYWLHRACHYYWLLWRLHEVHHSPDILYTLNVGRFHPLEKLLHFAIDNVPFLLLGVAPEVFAGYLLLYSVNGFFQHSNLKLHYGWLNYIVGSAETHRWHHARNPKMGACNFGNTTLVWDLLFGTWSLPGAMAADEVGILNRRYPKEFWVQLKLPFRKRDGTAN
jgi:ornithine lipid hydroxylase